MHRHLSPHNTSASTLSPNGSHATTAAAALTALAMTLALGLPSASAQTLTNATAAPATPLQASVQQLPQAPRALLWVGNSFFYYNNSIHHPVNQMAREVLGQPVRGTSVTISGAGLDWHDLESLLRPNGLGRYSFVGDNEIRFNPAGRQYDAVIMIDCSQCPLHPQLRDNFHATVRKNAEIARAKGVQPVLLMTWAYQDKPEMAQELAQAYTRAGNENQALVIPAGLAFARAQAERPDIALYVADKRHPSPAGTYLAAATAVATLYGRSVSGVKERGGLSEEHARYLQGVADEVVKQYHRR